MPKKELIVDYVMLLKSNFLRNGLHNLTIHLNKAIQAKDNKAIEKLKNQIENYEFNINNDFNPDI